jgi:outer membrane biosynthesis protein TonB
MTTPQGPQQPNQNNRPGPGGRPGAMTMAMQAVGPARPAGPKVLRIGVIQGDKMVEERIIRSRETVTVGTSEKNHFVIATPGLPPSFELFQLVGGDYILNFTDQMRGRVGLAGGVQALDQLRSTGAARNAGAYWQVKLADTSRGRVAVGDTTLLFQFIDPPPVQPRPQLPAAVVGGFVAGIDWLFTAFVMFSFMSHFGFIIFLENADWPIPPNLSTIPPELADIIFAEPEEPPEEPTEPTTDEPSEEVTEEVAEEEESHEPSEEAESTPSERQERADTDARMAAEDAVAQVDQLLLGALGESGALHDVLAGGAVTGSAADVLAQAEGVGVASTGSGTLRDRSGGGRVGTGGDLGGLRRAEGGTTASTEGGDMHEAAPRGHFRPIADADSESGSGDFDPQTVVRAINTRRSAIQACYERELRATPTLAGRVTIQMTIQEAGNVTGAHATANTTGNDDVATCVSRVISGLRFAPGPTDGSVTYTFPFVFEPQS